jgi:ornithine cyclodeaminase/alanine dehydrogenase-like protein (mu-crystallin family)
MPVRLIRDAELETVLDAAEAIDAVSAAVIEAGRTGAPRSRARIAFPAGGWQRLMTGALPETDVFGFKSFHLIAGGDIRYLCALWRLSDGAPLALLDGSRVTSLRTSATAAAAARAFWAEQPIRVAVAGSGAFARGGLQLLAAACDVREARVFSPRRASRAAFAESLAPELGIPVEPVDSVAAATAGADMLLCATQTRGAVAVRADDLGPDVRYVSSISSTLPSQRELDADVFAAVDEVVVDCPDVLEESGDALAAAKARTLEADAVVQLWEFLERDQGVGPLRRTLYKSIGSVEQDLGLAAHALRACEARGLGELVEPIELPRFIG